MRAKKCIVSCNLTKKNKEYLIRLGILDARTGKTKKNKFGTTSEILNQALTIVLESDKHPYSDVASNNDLMASWRKFNIQLRQREVDRLQEEMVSIADWKGDE